MARRQQLLAVVPFVQGLRFVEAPAVGQAIGQQSKRPAQTVVATIFAGNLDATPQERLRLGEAALPHQRPGVRPSRMQEHHPVAQLVGFVDHLLGDGFLRLDVARDRVDPADLMKRHQRPRSIARAKEEIP